jgi:hypothetical protein
VAQVKILKFLAPLFYANCSVLKDRVAGELLHRSALPDRFQWRALVLCFAAVSHVDTTAMQALDEVVAQCHATGVPLVIATANAMVEESLAAAGVVERLGGPKFIARRVHEAVRLVLLRELPKPAGMAAGVGADAVTTAPAGRTEASAAVGNHGGPAWWRLLRCRRRGGGDAAPPAGGGAGVVAHMPRHHLPSDPGAPSSPHGSGDLALRS